MGYSDAAPCHKCGKLLDPLEGHNCTGVKTEPAKAAAVGDAFNLNAAIYKLNEALAESYPSVARSYIKDAIALITPYLCQPSPAQGGVLLLSEKSRANDESSGGEEERSNALASKQGFDSPAPLQTSEIIRQATERVIAGCLRTTIEAHGDIHRKNISSAAKRITNQLQALAAIHTPVAPCPIHSVAHADGSMSPLGCPLGCKRTLIPTTPPTPAVQEGLREALQGLYDVACDSETTTSTGLSRALNRARHALSTPSPNAAPSPPMTGDK